MVFREWREFVVYPTNPDRVRSRDARLNTADAFRVGPDGHYPPDYHSGGNDRAAVIPLSTVIFGDDIFECMDVDDFGHVLIWTRDKVWFLNREGINGGIEKLRYLPRHPPDARLPS